MNGFETPAGHKGRMNRRTALALTPLLLAAGPVRAAADPDPAPTDSYAPVPTLTATLPRTGGARPGMMSVECGIDAPDPAVRARADQSAPRLRAALAQVVQRHAATLRPQQPPDIERLLPDLQAAVNAVMGRPGARLLIGTVMVG